MVCQPLPNHRNSKFQTTLLALGPTTQILGACLAYHVWRPSFILVTKFHTKISMVSTLYETCDWIPVRNNGVFAADVAEYIGPDPFHSPAKEKYQLVKNWRM